MKSAYAADDVVMVNMDETAVESLIPHRQGNSVVFRPMSVAAGHVYERIARRDSHGHVTLMGCVSSVPELQPVLPQFILANDARISRAEALKLRSLRAPLLWLEGCAGWVNSESFCQILTRLRRAIIAVRPSARLVIACDSATQHTTLQVVNHAARLRVQLLYIPGRLTWLLQPLDTHVFGAMKHRLHHVQSSARAASTDGTLTRTDWIDFLEQVVHEFLVSRLWHHCFLENGLVGISDGLRERVRRDGGVISDIISGPPTDDSFALILGRTRRGLAARLNRAGVHNQLRGEEPPLAAVVAPMPFPDIMAAAAREDVLSAPAPIASRTRSRSALQL
jgi:hypothetical protein